MIPPWVYVELPALFAVGIAFCIIFKWSSKRILAFSLGFWVLGFLVDYLMIAPTFNLFYYSVNLFIAMGFGALAILFGWGVAFKFKYQYQGKCSTETVVRGL